MGKAAAASKNKGLNIKGMNVLDLRFHNPDGARWDFTLKEHQELALALIDKDQPDWIIAAPPCRYFSILNWNCNYKKMKEEDVKNASLMAWRTYDLFADCTISNMLVGNISYMNTLLRHNRGNNDASKRSYARPASTR